MKQRMALYLQDAHDLRDGLEYAQYAEKRGLKLFGRPKADWFAMQSFPWQPMPLLLIN